MSKPGPQRFTSNTKQGRQIMSARSKIYPGTGISEEQRAWNAQVEAKKSAKKGRKARVKAERMWGK